MKEDHHMTITGNLYQVRMSFEKALLPDKVLNHTEAFFRDPEASIRDCFEHISIRESTLDLPAFLDYRKKLHLDTRTDNGCTLITITEPAAGCGCSDSIYIFGPDAPRVFLVETNKLGIYPDKKFYYEVTKVVPKELSGSVACTKWVVKGSGLMENDLEVLEKIRKGEGMSVSETHTYPLT